MFKTANRLAAFVCLVLILLDVYTSGTLTDSLEEGSFDVSFSNDLKNETSVLRAQESTLNKAVTGCSKDSDCHHAGTCTRQVDGQRVCECRNGTSGSLCQKVDECVANPFKCGNGSDVLCLFDVVREEATCKCENASKEFDYTSETCMVPCTTYSNCSPYGYCLKGFESKLSKYFCRCKLGASGDWCQIVDQCQSKEVDCGSDPGVICALGKKGKAYCKCKDAKQGFDYDNKTCKNCECGDKYVSCKFENGTKICDCSSKYKQRFDECALCNCGYYALDCSFNAAGEKNCTCKPSYTQGKSGECIDQCNSSAWPRCENGGTCKDKVCHCPRGTSGNFCDDVDWCENFRCGRDYDAKCVYNPETTGGECKCREDNSVYDDNAKICLACDCGSFGSCTYANGSNICKCQEGYSLYRSKCQKCDCGKGVTSCTLKYGEKKCFCEKKYAPRTGYFPMYGRDTRCDECDCGEHGECSFYRDSKNCECEEHYLERSGKCEECFCGPHGTCKFEDGNPEKVCTCEFGYAPRYGECVPCNCDPPDVRGIGARCFFNEDIKHCECPNGFEFEFNRCVDIDECAKGSPCPLGTNCVNVPGSYECECKTGYELAWENDDPKIDGCRDVNECYISGTCVSTTTRCVNNLGSYDCVCRDGYYATAATRGDSYVPMYNSCYGEETQWRAAAITLAVILGLGGLLVTCFFLKRK